MSNLELNNLLEASRIHNKAKGITGLLLYIEGDFLQIIEGEDWDINNLYGNIVLDKRHKNIICVNDEKIEKRQFPDWSMGFNTTNYSAINKNPAFQYLNKRELINFNDKTAYIFIDTFVNSYKNLISF